MSLSICILIVVYKILVLFTPSETWRLLGRFALTRSLNAIHLFSVSILNSFCYVGRFPLLSPHRPLLWINIKNKCSPFSVIRTAIVYTGISDSDSFIKNMRHHITFASPLNLICLRMNNRKHAVQFIHLASINKSISSYFPFYTKQ